MRNILLGYSIEVDKTAEKALAKLDAKIRSKIIEKIKALVSEENHGLDIKKLEGYENFYRIKTGNYRIV
jgi:mRNA-degrading endonuclease RelE of RelBE toxin-antitoxin system